MQFQEFQRRIFAVFDVIQDSLESHPPAKAMRPPQGWPALQASVRTFAEGLILSSSVDKAISKLREDQATLLSVVLLTTDLMQPEDVVLAARRAHASAPDDISALPCYPFCSYLIELCNGLEIVRLPPK